MSYEEACSVLPEDREEIKTITENCDFVSSFIKELRNKNLEELSGESRRKIIEMQTNIQDLIGIQDQRKTGAIKKTFKPEIMEQYDDRNISGVSSDPDESAAESSRSARRKKTKYSEKNLLQTLIEKIDNREIPKIEPFDETSNSNLKKYLTRFEEYCSEKYKGRNYLWKTELEKNISGNLLNAFNILNDFDDDYYEMKTKLVEWYNDERESRKNKAKSRFENTTMKKGETVFMYSKRLEVLFKTAFPKQNIEHSNILIQKFKSTVSRGMRVIINNQILQYKLNEVKLEWSRLKKCSRVFDLEIKNKDSESDSDGDVTEIKVNFNSKDKTYQKQSYSPNVNNHSGNNSNNNQPQNTNNFRNRYNQDRGNYWNNYPNQSYQQRQNNRYNNSYQQGNNYKNNHQQQSNTSDMYHPRNSNINSYRNNRQDGYSQPPPMRQSTTCRYCNRFGHEELNCRKKLNSCFICGNTTHYYRQCVQYKIRGRRMSTSNTYTEPARPDYRTRTQSLSSPFQSSNTPASN